MSDATNLLKQAALGDAGAAEQLLPLIYAELRQLAQQRLAQERPDHTLQATALVHEAYLRLVESDGDVVWDGRAHFFAAAAEAMRRILIDSARRKHSQKRGGGWGQVDIDRLDVVTNKKADELLAVDEALTEFEREEPEKAKLVKLRFYAGMSIPEAAEVLGISVATANRRWVYSKAWLQQKLEE
jgi:RNA polymerase sigma factor (TIGR02999 family)